jgi:MscS family membrane protein
LRFILSEVRRLLYSHPKVESNTVRVRLIDIAGAAPNVEVFSYILTQDFNEFAAVREDLLLRIMDVVDNSGSGLALPAQTLYLGRDAGLTKDKAETAVQKVAELREGQKLPFPDFHKEEISSFKGSIDYPPKESTLRKGEDGAGKSR